METAFIKADQVTKIYDLSVKGLIRGILMRILGGKVRFQTPTKPCVAVDHVSFEIREGERVGIIGPNGAGKTTLIQMMAGLLEPTSGSVTAEGTRHCILQLGVGIREDLTGRENIYLMGQIDGKTREEMDRFASEIIEFADLGPFIDKPVRIYSSGMKARLAFAMIVTIDPEILMIDEALSVGDARFVRKASVKMKELCSKGKIVILVSHSLGAIREFCQRSVWLDRGHLVMDGDSNRVTDAYLQAVRSADEAELKQRFRKAASVRSLVPGFQISEPCFFDKDGKSRFTFDLEEDMCIRFNAEANWKILNPDFKIIIKRSDGLLILENMAGNDGFHPRPLIGQAEFEIGLGPVRFGKNLYRVSVELHDRDRQEGPSLLAVSEGLFRVENPVYEHANPISFPPAEWSTETQEEKVCF